jgi:hypothetical protein
MPKTKDILSKVWLRRGTDGILSRRLCGGKIIEQLPTEQPRISNRQVDMLVRNDLGVIRHIEFQASNDPDFAFRMLEYFVYLQGEFGQPIEQSVFYIGSEPMRLQPKYETASTTHRFEIINLQEYSAAELLASPDWGDNLWALGANGDRPVVLGEVLVRLAGLPSEERESALAELTALSGILKLDSLLQQRLKEFTMLDYDLRENAVVRPLIEEAERIGRQGQLLFLLAEKFGPLPDWVKERVQVASSPELDRWARRFVHTNSLNQTFE